MDEPTLNSLPAECFVVCKSTFNLNNVKLYFSIGPVRSLGDFTYASFADIKPMAIQVSDYIGKLRLS